MEIIKPTDITVEHKGILKAEETLKNGDGTLRLLQKGINKERERVS